MKLLFTTRDDSDISKVIRDVTKEPVSHVAIQINGWLVVHSNLLGVNIQTLKRFKEENNVVLEYNVLKPVQYRPKLEELDGKPYDGRNLAFGLFMLKLRRCLPFLVPKQNLWQVSGMYTCVEFISELLFEEEWSEMTLLQFRDKLLTLGMIK